MIDARNAGSRPRWLAALALAVAAPAGCSPPASPPEGRGGRVAVELHPGGPPRPPARTVARLHADAEWTVEGAVGEMRALDGAERPNLVVPAGGDFVVRVPLEDLPAGDVGFFQRPRSSCARRAGARRRFRVAPRWQSGAIDLGGLPDRALSIRCALEGPPGAVCGVAEPRIQTTGRDAPTVLLVTSDTHRADHVGVAPSGVAVRTPTLDALAERGVLFERAFSSTNIPGESMLPLLLGAERAEAEPGPVFALANSGLAASVTRGRDHLILHLREHPLSEGRKYEVELFDLVRDPDCENDLAPEEPERASELRALLVDWLRAASPEDWVGERSDGAELLEGLRAPGYSDEGDGSAARPRGGERPARRWIGDDFPPGG